MNTADVKELQEVARQEARIALTLSGGHEVDDVVQTSIAQYLERAGRTEIKNPGALVRIIARRCAWKYRDKWEAKRGDRPLHKLGGAGEDDGAGRVDLIADVEAPEDILISRKAAELVTCAVDQLDPEDREIASLTYLNDPPRTAPEVAEHLHLAAGTVRNRLVRIRRLLTELLDDLPE
jgi:RNA polymerase sigma factor (sigma-70 family)